MFNHPFLPQMIKRPRALISASTINGVSIRSRMRWWPRGLLRRASAIGTARRMDRIVVPKASTKVNLSDAR